MSSNEQNPQQPELPKTIPDKIKTLNSILALIDAWNDSDGVLESFTAVCPEDELERAINRLGRWVPKSQPGG